MKSSGSSTGKSKLKPGIAFLDVLRVSRRVLAGLAVQGGAIGALIRAAEIVTGRDMDINFRRH